MSEANEKCIWFIDSQTKCPKFKFNSTDYCMMHQYVASDPELDPDDCVVCRFCSRFVRSSKIQTYCCYVCRIEGKVDDPCKKIKCDVCNLRRKIEEFVIKDEFVKTCIVCREQARREQIEKNKLNSRVIDKNGYVRCLADKCGKLCPPDHFIGLRGQTIYCRECREKQRLRDLKRQGRKRACNGYEKKPERKAAKIYRYRNDDDAKINTYKHHAKEKNLKFELTDERCYKYFDDLCFYCGYIPVNGMQTNGIDRVNSGLHYYEDNCVSCCSSCNMLKGNRYDDVGFIQISEHILTNLGLLNGSLHPELQRNSYSGSYQTYIQRELKRLNEKYNITFPLNYKELSNTEKEVLHKEFYVMREIDFYKIKSGDCYICGKKNTINNSNGIDRLDNSRGYSIDNCFPCCLYCNFTKKDYNLKNVIEKFGQICLHHGLADDDIIGRINSWYADFTQRIPKIGMFSNCGLELKYGDNVTLSLPTLDNCVDQTVDDFDNRTCIIDGELKTSVTEARTLGIPNVSDSNSTLPIRAAENDKLSPKASRNITGQNMANQSTSMSMTYSMHDSIKLTSTTSNSQKMSSMFGNVMNGNNNTCKPADSSNLWKYIHRNHSTQSVPMKNILKLVEESNSRKESSIENDDLGCLMSKGEPMELSNDPILNNKSEKSKDQCSYCGSIPNSSKSHPTELIDEDESMFSERIPICIKCKNIKGENFNRNKFLDYVSHVLIIARLMRGQKNYIIIPDSTSASFEYYMLEELKKNIKTNWKKATNGKIDELCAKYNLISRENFKSIQNQNCYLCGKRSFNKSNRHNNIYDLKNYEIACTPNNCIPCCKCCHSARNATDLSLFFKHLVKIGIHNNMIRNITDEDIDRIVNNIIKTNYCTI